jgi:copper homeostasis protein
MNVTFHRAFDLSKDPVQSLNELVNSGAERILTSGRRQSAPEGMAHITRLNSIGRSGNNNHAWIWCKCIKYCRIMCRVTGATEIHASARRLVQGGMKYSNPEVNLHAGSSIKDNSVLLPDPEQIAKMKNELRIFI